MKPNKLSNGRMKPTQACLLRRDQNGSCERLEWEPKLNKLPGSAKEITCMRLVLSMTFDKLYGFTSEVFDEF